MLEIVAKNNHILKIKDTVDNTETLVTPEELQVLKEIGVEVIDKSESVNRGFAKAKLLGKNEIVIGDCGLIKFASQDVIMMINYRGNNEVAIIPEGVELIGVDPFREYEHIDRIYLPDSLRICAGQAFYRLKDTKVICESPDIRTAIEENFIMTTNSLNSVFNYGEFNTKYMSRLFVIPEDDVNESLNWLFMLDPSLSETAKKIKQNTNKLYKSDNELITYDISTDSFHIYIDNDKYFKAKLDKELRLHLVTGEVNSTENEGKDTVILLADKEYYNKGIDYTEYDRYVAKFGTSPLYKEIPEILSLDRVSK